MFFLMKNKKTLEKQFFLFEVSKLFINLIFFHGTETSEEIVSNHPPPPSEIFAKIEGGGWLGGNSKFPIEKKRSHIEAPLKIFSLREKSRGGGDWEGGGVIGNDFLWWDKVLLKVLFFEKKFTKFQTWKKKIFLNFFQMKKFHET